MVIIAVKLPRLLTAKRVSSVHDYRLLGSDRYRLLNLRSGEGNGI